jgi:hypothetical protein
MESTRFILPARHCSPVLPNSCHPTELLQGLQGLGTGPQAMQGHTFAWSICSYFKLRLCCPFSKRPSIRCRSYWTRLVLLKYDCGSAGLGWSLRTGAQAALVWGCQSFALASPPAGSRQTMSEKQSPNWFHPILVGP